MTDDFALLFIRRTESVNFLDFSINLPPYFGTIRSKAFRFKNAPHAQGDILINRTLCVWYICNSPNRLRFSLESNGFIYIYIAETG